MKEFKAWKLNGFLAILIILALVVGGISLLFQEVVLWGILLLVIAVLLGSGIWVVPPNKAAVVTFFGSYVGTIRESGLWMSYPLTMKKMVSLRVRNFNSKTLKVNDTDGNPIEIAAVVVFKVVDTSKAVFDVDNYVEFVEIQSETALRHVSSKYPYDRFDGEGYSLRGNAEEVAQELGQEVQARLSLAGVEVLEVRLTHLAYATEIAGAMLQRQQAAAILAAREKIVEGAIGMVSAAIQQLQAGGVVELDEERKATMVNNLMVAIVSDRSAQPVINTGSIY